MSFSLFRFADAFKLVREVFVAAYFVLNDAGSPYAVRKPTGKRPKGWKHTKKLFRVDDRSSGATGLRIDLRVNKVA